VTARGQQTEESENVGMWGGYSQHEVCPLDRCDPSWRGVRRRLWCCVLRPGGRSRT
jgi:hypothetical protein